MRTPLCLLLVMLPLAAQTDGDLAAYLSLTPCWGSIPGLPAWDSRRCNHDDDVDAPSWPCRPGLWRDLFRRQPPDLSAPALSRRQVAHARGIGSARCLASHERWPPPARLVPGSAGQPAGHHVPQGQWRQPDESPGPLARDNRRGLLGSDFGLSGIWRPSAAPTRRVSW